MIGALFVVGGLFAGTVGALLCAAAGGQDGEGTCIPFLSGAMCLAASQALFFAAGAA
ncbi:hypothetical protein [uncultured Paracoccus sp.]|uniref:hypothetical protein n=1 Tax=uncultured Paracoccus sp. TaxID=189685 RepID=UPI0025FFF60C|nr:hypothetical protein [uncultured Paracoccus sp.]